MRTKLTLIGVVLVGLLAFSSLASAEIPGGGWWSGEQVQNVGNDTAHLVVTAYDADSSATYVATYDVGVGSAYNFLPSDFAGMPDGFNGSAIVESDQPVKAITNVSNRKAGSYGVTGGQANAQYQGIETPANELNFPMAKINHYGKTVTFYIQNGGSAATTTGSAAFKMRNGDTHNYTLPAIGPGQMIAFTAQDAGADPNDADRDGRIGGVTVTADQPLAGVAMEHRHVENPATVLQGTRGFSSADYDSTYYAPMIKHDRYGRYTGIQVQNVSGGPINIVVTYKGSAGACAGQTYSEPFNNLGDRESKTFVQNDANSTPLPHNCAAAATIAATGDVVAVVNEAYTSDYLALHTELNQAEATYNAFPDAGKSTKLSAPMYKENRYGTTTGLQIQNVGSVQATNVVLTFSCLRGTTDLGSFTTVPQTIDAGFGKNFTRVSQNASLWSGAVMPENAACSVTVTGDQPLLGIANEQVFPFVGAALQLDVNNYEAFNLQ